MTATHCPRCQSEMARVRGQLICLSRFCVPMLPFGGAPSVKSRTSAAAAGDIADLAGSLRARILTFIAARGSVGSTCDEIEVALSLRHQTASARIRELVLMGLIRDGEWERQTRSRRWAVVWVEIHTP